MGLSTIILAGLSFGDLLRAADQADVFYYVLPFLLIFALVYGILTNSAILGTNKGVNVILAVALGLLGLVGNYFPNFIQTMAPNLAIGLSILLAVIILLGLFYKDTDVKWIKYIFVAVGAIAFIVVAYSSLSQYGSSNSFLWQQYGSALIVLVILGIIIGFAVKDK
jgi:hypothetical protein